MTLAATETEGLLFSDDWERAFGGLVARVRWDPKLAGLQLAGWFRAHPKASLSLSRRDLQVFNRFFREPWQIGVVLQPQNRSARGRVFVREADPTADPFSSQDVMVRWSGQSIEQANLPTPRAITPISTELPAHGPPRPKRPFWPAVVVAAAVAGTAWWMLQPPQTAPPTVQRAAEARNDANQDATQQAETLWKKWESEARLKDGSVPSGPDPLHDGTRNYPGDLPSADIPPAAQSAVPPNSSLSQEEARKPAAPQKLKSFVEPSAPAPPPVRPVIESPPPLVSASAAPDSAAHSVVLPPAPTPTPPLRPVVRQEATPAAPKVPSSGRVIWTGHVRKNDFIIFDGGKASVGSLSGALPGVPVKLTVSPGDLTKDGLTIYTARLRGSNGPAEAPGPQNGWNKTIYLWDPGRTADFEVAEAPNPRNGWKRLVLRARNPHDSIVMIEWSAQQ